jgi:DNA gyrase subunit A
LSDFSNPRKAGIIAVDLNEGDFLVGAAITDGQHDVMLFSDAGKAVRFDENDVRPMGRTARGVRGMNLGDGHQVIAMLVAPAEVEGAQVAVVDTNGIAIPSSVLTATENGYGKRTSSYEYRVAGRGGKGITAMAVNTRNGDLVASFPVAHADQIMLVTDGGQLIRCPVEDIRTAGRATQGVIVFRTASDERVVSVERIGEDENEGDEADGVVEG